MAKLSKDFEIEFTPEEVGEILKDHVRVKNELRVDDVYFNVERVYDSSNGYDEHGTMTMTRVKCCGKLK